MREADLCMQVCLQGPPHPLQDDEVCVAGLLRRLGRQQAEVDDGRGAARADHAELPAGDGVRKNLDHGAQQERGREKELARPPKCGGKEDDAIGDA